MNTDLETKPAQEEEAEEQRVVRCKACLHEITTPARAIQPHEHTFRNPAGYSFHLLRYGDAPGAADAGDATAEASWFPGHAWSFAICKQCHQHLGWWYTGDTRFVGLIATRVLR
jgi:hypothetical protein